MIVWSGFGFLALLLPIVTVFITTAVANATGGPLYSTLHHWPGAVGAILGAGLVYLASVKLETPGRTLVDPATGQAVVLRRRHTLFWIPLRFWAIVIAVVGLVYLVLPAAPANGTSVSAHTSGADCIPGVGQDVCGSRCTSAA